MKDLCGVQFAYNAVKYDYCFLESIKSLIEFCDYVIVAAGGEDSTLQDLKKIRSEKLLVIPIKKEEWEQQQGKEKLSYFSNIAINKSYELGFKYNISVQSDEIIHEKSYPAIRKAIATGSPGFMVTRHNLWGSPYRLLDVPHDRKPCSTEVIRLAKTDKVCVDDAESLGVDNVDVRFVNDIVMYHMGYVRRRSVMRNKIINMQQNVFGMDYDKKLDEAEQFDPWLWFDKDKDTKIINEPLPRMIREWAAERAGDYE